MYSISYKTKRGFTMFFAVLVASLALAIGLAILDLTMRQLQLSEVTSQSQYAIYAADTGAECALYWDNKCTGTGCVCTSYDPNNPGTCIGGTAFATSTKNTGAPSGSGLACEGYDISTLWNKNTTNPPDNLQISDTLAATTFTLNNTTSGSCATVEVEKTFTLTNGITYPHTTILSYGYNTCTPNAPNLVQRELEVDY